MAGRKWKYRVLVEGLNDGELYPVSKIVNRAEALGFFEYDLDSGRPLFDEDRIRAKRNARSALAKLASTSMPAPDGQVEVQKPYRSFYPAWFGKTWKNRGHVDKE